MLPCLRQAHRRTSHNSFGENMASWAFHMHSLHSRTGHQELLWERWSALLWKWLPYTILSKMRVLQRSYLGCKSWILWNCCWIKNAKTTEVVQERLCKSVDFQCGITMDLFFRNAWQRWIKLGIPSISSARSAANNLAMMASMKGMGSHIAVTTISTCSLQNVADAADPSWRIIYPL